MKHVALLLAQGFEPAEAIIVVDVLRRLGIAVDLLACQGDLEVLSYFDIRMKADALLADNAARLYDAVICPGGPQGARNLGANVQVVDFLKAHLAAERLVCTICSAGAHVLAANGLLEGKRYVCSGENHTLYGDGKYVDEKVVKHGNILTGKGLGTAFEFALALGTLLVDPQIVANKAEHIYFDYRPGEMVCFD